jgi:hypothetical protein
MRKPAVVAIILALSLFITLARRLAQPAIADHEVAAAEPVSAPAPMRPTVSHVPPEVPKSELSVSSRLMRPASSRTKRGAVSSSAITQVDAAKHENTRYEALLASPDHAFARVRDYGAHGIGTPKWIESLSGAKARVPVRDFAAEEGRKNPSNIEPLAVPVNSQVELAH